MEFLDKLKVQAMDVATTVAERTQETAKTGQLQMQLRTLKGEEKDALTEFGRSAYTLYSQNGLAERSGELAGAAAKLAELRRQVDEKVAEIAELKGDTDEDADSDDAPVETVAEELPADDSSQ
jgi:cell division protein FtsB